MIECNSVTKVNSIKGLANTEVAIRFQVVLNYEQRQKSRARCRTTTGEELAWLLPRSQILEDGDCLQSVDGILVGVIAADETLSEVCSEDSLLLTKAAYHLGNRHVPLQIHQGALSYQHDHVLDAMVMGLGLTVRCVQKPFHPQSGAYHSHQDSKQSHHGHHHE